MITRVFADREGLLVGGDKNTPWKHAARALAVPAGVAVDAVSLPVADVVDAVEALPAAPRTVPEWSADALNLRLFARPADVHGLELLGLSIDHPNLAFGEAHQRRVTATTPQESTYGWVLSGFN